MKRVDGRKYPTMKMDDEDDKEEEEEEFEMING